VPGKHYMADISEKLRQIMAMVEKGDYFTINRAAVWQNHNAEYAGKTVAKGIYGHKNQL